MLRLETTNQSIMFYDSLAKVEEQLNRSSFYRSTRSVLINLDNIVAVDIGERKIEMANGAVCEGVAKKMSALVEMWKKWNE